MSAPGRTSRGLPRSLAFLTLLLVVAIGAIWGLRAYEDRLRSGSAGGIADGAVARVYFACTREGKPRMTAVTRRVPTGPDAAAAALREMTKGLVPRACSPPLPPGTQVVSVSVSQGLATADFSEELVSRFVGGADNEAIVVYSIVNTLSSLPHIDRVQITVAGSPVESIGGHIDISRPVRADDELVVPMSAVDSRSRER